MYSPMVAIVDYGIGNHTSLLHTMRKLGFRARVSHSAEVLDQADVLLLPGVGAFPTAMSRLHSLDLVNYLSRAAQLGRPLVAICLGMQLLAESFTEVRLTTGLGLIPGSVIPIRSPRWHIGWNVLEVAPTNHFLHSSDGDYMYFNYSYCYSGPDVFISARCRVHDNELPLVAAISRGSVLGLQFYPEKSQLSGLNLLRRLIGSMVH